MIQEALNVLLHLFMRQPSMLAVCLPAALYGLMLYLNSILIR